VYNCGGYENPEIVEMLAGMVEIYLPGFQIRVGKKMALPFFKRRDIPVLLWIP